MMVGEPQKSSVLQSHKGGIKMKILKNILNWVVLALGGKNELTDKAVNDGICDFSGQGRDEFGK